MVEKIIHRLWLGPNKMPENYINYGLEWKNLNPDWDVIEWNESNLPDLINIEAWNSAGESAKASVPMSHERAVAVQRADILGYEIVWRYGGVYVNCDIQPLRSMDELLLETGDSAFACYEANYGGRMFLVNSVLGGPSNHPFWKSCVDSVSSRFVSIPEEPMEVKTGPWLITEEYERWKNHNYRVTALPINYFNPVHWSQISVGSDASDMIEYAKSLGSYGIHHWGHRENMGRLG